MNVSYMIENGIKELMRKVTMSKCLAAYLLNNTHQSKFN